MKQILIQLVTAFIGSLGFGLLFLQGLSELVKRFAALRGLITLETKNEKPLQ